MNNRKRLKLKSVLKGPKFTDQETWNIGFVLARHIYAGLIQFKANNINSFPYGFNSIEEWHNTLDKMIWSFREISQDYPSLPYNIEFNKWYEQRRKNHEMIFSINLSENGKTGVSIGFVYTDDLKTRDLEYQEKLNEGKELFAKYIENLWD